MTATRVLVVDDEIIIAREVETRLMNLGYEVVGIASSGQEAVDLAERTRPDLVLMDIVLKGDTDGIEAAAEIRKRWGIPIIYLTAYADEVTLRRAQVTEPFGYIVKPFTERELRANIEMALYKHSTEAKLLAIEKWFAASMRQIEDGVVATDAEGRITFMNQVAEVLTGLRSDEVIGRTVNEAIPLLSRTPKLVPQIPQEAQNGLIVEVGGDILLRHQGMNEEIPIHLAVTPLRDFHGNAAGAVMVVRDLSEQKRADELRRKMAERDLQAQKLEAAGLMAGKIAHQFNNLLSVILGHSLIQLSHEQMNEDFRESLTRIKEAADRAGRLTNQLLAISCRQALEPRVLDLNELVAEMEKEVRQSIGESTVLTVSQTPDLWKVKVDPGQTKRVIQNLALNARDAMPQGGRLTIKMANVEVEKSAETEFPELSPGRYVVLAVRDNGCGMSQEVKRRAFDPFFTTKEEGGGVGLGLATVYGTIRQSAGGVMVESEPGLGTTIRIYLPAVEDEAIIDDETIPPSLPSDLTSCEVVLVVEDDDMVRALIRHVLQSQGYTVLEAKRPEEAIAVCENHQGPVHLLATDIVMPGMDGGRLAERIIGLRPDIRVLFLSGYANDATLNDRVKDGRVSHLQKPFDIETLVDRVREALGRH